VDVLVAEIIPIIRNIIAIIANVMASAKISKK